MSPKKSSRRSSPKKEAGDAEKPVKSAAGGLKLRLKMKESEESVVVENKPPAVVPKIKLNFSRSNESVVNEEVGAAPSKAPGKRGRPKKDKSAVIAAAIAASQPNEIESEERKSRRRAAEDKIKRTASGEDIIITSTNTAEGEGIKKRRGRRPKNYENDAEVGGETDGRRRRRRRRSSEDDNGDENGNSARRQMKTSDFIDITSSVRNVMPSNTSYSPHENDFIQRSKTFLNISMQHDAFLYSSLIGNIGGEIGGRFGGFDDVVERLVPFHMGITAGQYSETELSAVNEGIAADAEKHASAFAQLQERYRSVLQGQSSKKVPTELLLLEQRLCLEEEKFLLVKLKNEYAAKFLKSNSNMGSSMSSVNSNSGRSSVLSSNSSRSDSVINE